MSPITASSFWNEGISQDLGCRDQCRLPKYAVHVNGLLIAGQLSALSCPPKLNFPQEREVAMQRSSFALLEFDPELNKLIKGKQLREGCRRLQIGESLWIANVARRSVFAPPKCLVKCDPSE
jgi:hypothetical protein